MRLAEATKDEVAALLANGSVAALVPVGSVEPHGPHLPLGTDTLISFRAAELAVTKLSGLGIRAAIAPAVPYGVTDFAAGFAGAVSVPGAALTTFLHALAAAILRAGFAHVSFINNHLEPAQDAAVRAAIDGLAPGRGSVACPLTRRFARTLSDEFKSGACHAGRYETSLVLAEDPHLVRRDVMRELGDVPISLSDGIRAGKSTFLDMGMTDAYAGAPALASREEGSELYERLADMVAVEVSEAMARLSLGQRTVFDKDGPTFFELLDQALKSTRGGYELLAPKFDKTPFRTPDVVVKRAVEELGDGVKRAIDLCTGTGAGLLALRSITTERLVGLDFSPAMLAEARKALGLEPNGLASLAADADRIELVEKDVFAMDFDKAFDVVTCFGALGHIPKSDEAKFLTLVRKALVPGGRFLFVTTDRPSPFDPRALVARGFNAAMHVRNAILSPPFVMFYLTFALPEIERLLKWTGFEVKLHRGIFEAPYQSMVAVVATRI